MSRRKQAKPRALKRELEDEAIENKQEMIMNALNNQANDTLCSTNTQTKDEIEDCKLGDVKMEVEGNDTCDDNDDIGSECQEAYRCGDCDNKFQSLKQFMYHRNFECTYCSGESMAWPFAERGDDSQSSPSSSFAVDSISPEEVPFSAKVDDIYTIQCHLCSKAFKNTHHLKHHIQVHQNEMPYNCSSCLRMFKHKRSRDRHMKIHSGSRSYQCTHCEVSFSRSDHLKTHMKTHSVDSLYLAADEDTPISHNDANCTESDTDEEKTEPNHTPNKSLHQNLLTPPHEVSTVPRCSNRALRCPMCNAKYDKEESFLEHLHLCHLIPQDDLAAYLTLTCPIKPVVKKTWQHACDTNMNSTYINDTLHFDCPYCDKGNFSTREVLEIHLHTMHAGKGPAGNVCHLCQAVYPSEGTLLEHIKADHQALGHTKHPCLQCSMEFSTADALAIHCDAIHRSVTSPSKEHGGIYPCPFCAKRLPTLTAQKEHIMFVHSHLQSPPFSCDSKESLNSPKISPIPSTAAAKPTTFNCDTCGATFFDNASYQAHLTLHTDQQTMRGNHHCSHAQCIASFNTEDELEMHVFAHYLNMSTEFGCTSCMKLFLKPDELQKHLMDIHAHHLYRCALCKEIFDSKVNIQVHFAVKHSNECKVYKCTNCSSVFRSEMEWKLHVKVHHLGESKPYRCLFCKDAFAKEAELQSHLQSHKKQFFCPQCDEAFHVEYLLDRHISRVHGSVPHTSEPQQQIEAADVTHNDVGSHSEATTDNSFSPAHRSARIWEQRPPILSPQSSPANKCTICDVIFPDYTALTNHRAMEHHISPNNYLQNHSPPHPKSTYDQHIDKFSLVCVYCHKTFKTKSELEKHMKNHVTPSQQKCNICDESFPSPSVLAEHKLTHCKVVKGNVCVQCKTTLKDQEQFYQHAQQHGFQGSCMQCVVCRQTLGSMLELQLHGRHHFESNSGENRDFACCVCLASLESKEDMISKLNSNGRTYYVCKPCYYGERYGSIEVSSKTKDDLKIIRSGENFMKEAPFQAHSRSNDKTFQCIKCQETFSTEADIQAHVATHMKAEGNIQECRLCGKVFPSPRKLQCHLIEHTYLNASELTCHICGAEFRTSSAIQAHVLTHGAAARQYNCIKCPQKFFFSAELEHHIRGHDLQPKERDSDLEEEAPRKLAKIELRGRKDGPIKCTLCGQLFGSSQGLTQHYYIKHNFHSSPLQHISATSPVKESPSQKHAPEQAQYDQSGKKQLSQQRKRQQPPENPHLCPICGKSMYRKQILMEHIRLHAAQHTCHVCNGVFNDDIEMWRHMTRLHQPSDIFNCQICGQVQGNAESLQSHLVTVHNIQWDVLNACAKLLGLTKRDEKGSSMSPSTSSFNGLNGHTNENHAQDDKSLLPVR